MSFTSPLKISLNLKSLVIPLMCLNEAVSPGIGGTGIGQLSHCFQDVSSELAPPLPLSCNVGPSGLYLLCTTVYYKFHSIRGPGLWKKLTQLGKGKTSGWLSVSKKEAGMSSLDPSISPQRGMSGVAEPSVRRDLPLERLPPLSICLFGRRACERQPWQGQ